MYKLAFDKQPLTCRNPEKRDETQFPDDIIKKIAGYLLEIKFETIDTRYMSTLTMLIIQ